MAFQSFKWSKTAILPPTYVTITRETGETNVVEQLWIQTNHLLVKTWLKLKKQSTRSQVQIISTLNWSQLWNLIHESTWVIYPNQLQTTTSQVSKKPHPIILVLAFYVHTTLWSILQLFSNAQPIHLVWFQNRLRFQTLNSNLIPLYLPIDLDLWAHTLQTISLRALRDVNHLRVSYRWWQVSRAASTSKRTLPLTIRVSVTTVSLSPKKMEMEAQQLSQMNHLQLLI